MMAYLYVIDPIDFWSGWQKPEDVFKGTKIHDPVHNNFDWHVLWKAARSCASLSIWEGDVREGPYVTVLPPKDGCEVSPVAIAWKQDNNGTAFIYSPYELPWLEAEKAYYVNDSQIVLEEI
jgi:hypothetical protein